ncbi:hypothetical protein H4W31_002641 [Plantactinospora soyae]|uniref:non-specific serine/threonine protein kinase n=2 Tax=Plantactinospora soyae TaxID=1544732 RepID=A0A927QYX5_9ACTN|nr:hypothetical protein [Plantactinospora soyae]
MRERSLREARAIARLNHANVVRVFDVLRTDGDPWIVMEYVPSRSLQDVLAADGPVPATRAAEIGLGVLGALNSAHRAGVMHRDVKPGNVLLGDDGRVVLTDFGLATVPGDPNVTRTGLVLGSPAYIAPERARDGTAGPEGDLWSLGATLYAAVEGQSPFARPSAIATLAALATEPPPVSRRAGPMKAVLAGLLRKDPANRITADVAERLLRRASGRRRSPGMSLLDGVRRPGPNGPREPGEPRTRIVPLPAPRPAQEQPPIAPPPPPPAAPPAAETTKLPASSASAAAASAATPESPPTESVAESVTPDVAPAPAEPTVVVVPGDGDEKAAPEPTAVQPGVQPQPEAAPTQLVAPVAQPAGRATVPADRGAVHDGDRASSGPLAALTAGNRRLWLIGGVVVLLLGALFVIVPLANGGSDEDPGAGPGPNPTSQPAATPPAAATSTPPPTPAPTTAAATQPATTPTGQAAQPPLPNGWKIHRDNTGFSVPVPSNWTISREGPRVKFNDPNSSRFLMIDQTNSPRPDPVADWRSQEGYRKGDYSNYQRVKIVEVKNYWLKAADWEWLHTEGGVRMHVRNRGFVTSSKKAYAIRWDTAESDWAKNLPTFEIIATGFKPAGS